MDNFSFSADDLDANRVGKLSQGQRAILKEKRRSGLAQVGAGVGIFVAILIVAYLALQPNHYGQGICYPFLLLIAAFFGVLFVRLRHMNIGQDLRAGDVASARGALIVREELAISGGRRYVAEVGLARFALAEAVFVALSAFQEDTPRRECVIYYTPLSKTILSFEALEGAPPPHRPSFQEAVSRLYADEEQRNARK